MDFLDFALKVGKLKKLQRAGWIRENVKDPESVADHSFQTAIMAMVLAPFLEVDQNKLIKLALIHDVGETESGDLVWERGQLIDEEKREKKERIEKNAIRKILGKEYGELFHELTKRKTEEAKLLWQIDRLERMTQALEYEKEQGKDLTEFFVNADKFITHPKLREILDQVIQERKAV